MYRVMGYFTYKSLVVLSAEENRTLQGAINSIGSVYK
jgi:hypothetical protein